MTFPAGLTSALTDVQEETGAFSVVTVGKEGWRVVGEGGEGGWGDSTSSAAMRLKCSTRSKLVRKYCTASDSCPSDMPDAARPEGSLKGPLLLIMYSFSVSKLSSCSDVA